MTPEIQLNDFEKALVAAMPRDEASIVLPSRRDERWKWTDLRGALREAKQPSEATPVTATPLIAPADPLEFVFANGHLTVQPDDLPDGVALSADDGDERRFKEKMPNIALEKAEHTYVLRVSGKVTRPIQLRFLSEGGGMHHTSVEIVLEQGAEASVIETLEGGEGAWFANGVMRYALGEGASLERLIVQQANEEAVIVHHAGVELAKGVTFTQATLGFGAKLCRIETQGVHLGEGARAVLNGAYLLSGKRHIDNTTDIAHTAPGCATEELYKGVLADRGRGVFQGRFHVARAAQKTDARMAHNALLLSDTAEVDAKPELMIYADDVECAHGNTAGALDEEALFYMRQRGLSEREARALLIQAFVAEAFVHITDEEIAGQLTSQIETWLEARPAEEAA